MVSLLRPPCPLERRERNGQALTSIQIELYVRILLFLVAVVVRSPAHHLYIAQPHRGIGYLWMDEGGQRNDGCNAEGYRCEKAKGILHAYQRRMHGGLLGMVYVRGSGGASRLGCGERAEVHR